MSKPPSKEVVLALDPMAIKLSQAESAKDGLTSDSEQDTMLSAILKSLRSYEISQQRLAFESDPETTDNVGPFYRQKTYLTPDNIIKRIISPQGDELVCQILQARSNHIASFGRPRTSRFSLGFEFELIKGITIDDQSEEYQKLKERIRQLTEVIWNCGYGDVHDMYLRPNFSQFLKMITRDGLAYGRFAVEFIWGHDHKTNKRRCYAFRVVDASTIYRIMPSQEQDQKMRIRALEVLSQLKHTHFDKEKYLRDHYKWVQVINGKPVQVFTDDELVVYNLYPVTNVEYNGYPLSPIDQALHAITTHINITLHNKLYFQHGRAARGMLVVQSDDIDESMIQKIRLHFHQSINSVQNSWRMPVFGISSRSQLTWQPIEVTGRDAEFQYLADSNARVILSAFQMSPEELPGYAHLARGTNTQALAEADNEWKLIAARDVGLRPLLYDIQDFVNTHILPKFDEELSKKFQLVFAGLDRDSPEKESVRLSQDAALHLTYNDILERVEKDKIPVEMGGKFPLNQQFWQIADKYLTVGEILENFFNRPGAASDPRFNYYNNPIWLQYQQLLVQKTQLALQLSMQQSMQQSIQQSQQQPLEAPPQSYRSPGISEEEYQKLLQEHTAKKENWLANNYLLLEKAINNNSNVITNMLLQRHQESIDHAMSNWEKASTKAIKKILKAIKSQQ